MLEPGDLLVVNDARVSPYSLEGTKIPTGGRVKILLVEQKNEYEWKAMMKPGRRLHPGTRFAIEAPMSRLGVSTAEVGARVFGEVQEKTADGFFLIKLSEQIQPLLKGIGMLPVPPYIKAPLEKPELYQTIFALREGALAAPTASLHFDPPLVERLNQCGIALTRITLLIGVGAIITSDRQSLPAEWAEISEETAELIQKTRKSQGGRVIAVGTSTVRTLEYFAKADGTVFAGQGWVNLFIQPGFRFQVINGMVTNYHLPRSTHLSLVAAFLGKEKLLKAYKIALKEGYRFLSLGDAMLIV